METKELLSLLVAMLKDEIVGKVEEKDESILITFLNGTKKTVTVQ